MINQDKWINSIPKTVIKSNEEANQVDNYRWVNTISKKDTYNNVTTYNNFAWKYSLLVVLFVCIHFKTHRISLCLGSIFHLKL